MHLYAPHPPSSDSDGIQDLTQAGNYSASESQTDTEAHQTDTESWVGSEGQSRKEIDQLQIIVLGWTSLDKVISLFQDTEVQKDLR